MITDKNATKNNKLTITNYGTCVLKWTQYYVIFFFVILFYINTRTSALKQKYAFCDLFMLIVWGHKLVCKSSIGTIIFTYDWMK